MRNWNTKQNSYNKRFGWVFSVPMRNWNTPECSRKNLPSHPFSAYLWGIEPLLLPGVSPPRPFSAYLWGIETGTIGFSPKLRLRFQRTYEELKLPLHILLAVFLWVFSVHMRNWNWAEMCNLAFAFSVFLQYLWGIETLYVILTLRPGNSF